ncbi:MAG TPA: hypothetical protein VJ779_10340 [Acetobacteraceae bacterium]|nr:hypothetical protein [Acetobacteraceae bacterium]
MPDGAFILENVETGKRAHFFVEMDMATERIMSRVSHEMRLSVRGKFEQYDKYLEGLRFSEA